jgi:endoglycosylceramidase
VGRGFGKLYDKGHELNNRFMKYWEKVAQTFKGNPYVIAYELINEPWIGNIWRDPALIIPSMA